MKKLLALLIASFAIQAHAQTAYAVRLDQRNAANTGYISKFVPPNSSTDCVFSMPSSAAGATPICLVLSSDFVVSSGTISVPVTTGPQGPQGPQGVQGIQGVAGNDGANGTNGTNGTNGQSAYEIAVANGFVGTEAQWLASLQASVPARSFAYQTRSLNNCFQVSGTRDAMVSYSVDIATSLSLTTGQQGTVYLRIYSDSGCSTGTQELTRFVNGQTGTLTIGLALTQNVTGTLTGIVPAGAYVQLVTQNNTGTPTFTARPGQEVLL